MAKKIFVDALPIVEGKLSGIGHLIVETIRAMEADPQISKDYQIILLVPFTKRGSMRQWNFRRARERTYPFPGRILSKAESYHILPPLDLVFGRGTYLFMNYKNWPLTPFSRSLTWIHDAAFVLFPQYVQPKNQRYLEKNVRRWMRRSDVVVTISNQSAAELAQYAPESAAKMKLVSIGIDREIFYPKSAEEVRDVQKRYALTTPYLCFLSTIEPRKNLDTLISAFERLQAKKPDLSLLLIGGRGWLNEGILDHIERARQQGCKIITPDKYVPDEDLPALLSGAEILVHPSFHEGFGIAPLQAMACGTPVVASDIPVTREILQDACLYFDTTDESDLAKQIEKVLDDPILSSGLIKKGSERVNAYTWGAVIEQLKSLLK